MTVQASEQRSFYDIPQYTATTIQPFYINEEVGQIFLEGTQGDVCRILLGKSDLEQLQASIADLLRTRTSHAGHDTQEA